MPTERPVRGRVGSQEAVAEEAGERAEADQSVERDHTAAQATSTHGTEEDDEPGESVGHTDVSRERRQTGKPGGDEERRE